MFGGSDASSRGPAARSHPSHPAGQGESDGPGRIGCLRLQSSLILDTAGETLNFKSDRHAVHPLNEFLFRPPTVGSNCKIFIARRTNELIARNRLVESMHRCVLSVDISLLVYSLAIVAFVSRLSVDGWKRKE